MFHEDGNEGKCLNRACLTERNRQHLVASCQAIVAQNPDVEVCQPKWGNNNEDVYTELSEQGHSVEMAYNVHSYPERPQYPIGEDYETSEEFTEAKVEFDGKMVVYRRELDKIEQEIATGKAKRVVTIDSNRVELGYVTVSDEVKTAGAVEPDPKAKLEGQDKRNREIAVENIVEDTKKLIRNTELPQSDFTEIEEKYLYFTMLADLKRENFAKFSFDGKEKWWLDEEDKIEIISNLTEEQKTIIRRDFLIRHLSDTVGVAKQSFLMLEFARLHFPEELAGIETKYNDVYKKRHARIEQRLKALETAKQAEDAGSAEEIECAEDLKEVA
jgi:ParB family chromosome partitioning protein